MAEKVKQLFLSKNYLVIDSVVDCRLVFNPQGDGTSGGDVLYLRGGRWSFRINDFLAGELLPDGSREHISGNGVGYSVNIVWNDEDGEEPDYYTTYRNPANISALDGQLVQISGSIPIVGFDSLSNSVGYINNFLNANVSNVSDFTEQIKDEVIGSMPNIRDNVSLIRSNTNDIITNTSVIYNKIVELSTKVTNLDIKLGNLNTIYQNRRYILYEPDDFSNEVKELEYSRLLKGTLIILSNGEKISLTSDCVVYNDTTTLHSYAPCNYWDGANIREVLGFDVTLTDIAQVLY